MGDASGWTLMGDVPFGWPAGTELLLDILTPDPRPSGPLPVMIWIRGGGWETGNKRGGYFDTLGPG